MAPDALRQLWVRVLGERPHHPRAFTQGLVLEGDTLYESVGHYGASALRELDALTGAERRRVELPPHLFAEGLTKVGDRLFQLSWREGTALVWDVQRLAPVAQHRYAGEGWGLAFDGEHLVMSDGHTWLSFRDPGSFEVRRAVRVTHLGRPLAGVNELEWARGRLYANVWPTSHLVEIDPRTGCTTALIDASALVARVPRPARWRMDVLNGIAHDPASGRFLLTGKNWPLLFEVEFEPCD